MKIYQERNMAGTIPMIEEGKYKVIGGNNTMYIYMCKSKEQIESKFWPIS